MATVIMATSNTELTFIPLNSFGSLGAVQNTYEPTNAKHPNYYLGDFRLRNLKGCVVTLVESFGALRLQGVSERSEASEH